MGLLSWFDRIRGITFELNADDIVVFMVGPSGGGKSWFIQEVTNCDLINTSNKLPPCTTKVQAIRCELSARAKTALQVSRYNHIVFVDTPSFLADIGNDSELERNMTLWLRKSRCKSTLLGTIYVDRAANIPFLGPDTVQKHLNCFALTFPGPGDFPSTALPLRLHGVLTHNSEEDKITEENIRLRKNQFQQQFGTLHSGMFRGRRSEWIASFHHECFQQDRTEEAWNAVVALFTTTRNGRAL